MIHSTSQLGRETSHLIKGNDAISSFVERGKTLGFTRLQFEMFCYADSLQEISLLIEFDFDVSVSPSHIIRLYTNVCQRFLIFCLVSELLDAGAMIDTPQSEQTLLCPCQKQQP